MRINEGKRIRVRSVSAGLSARRAFTLIELLVVISIIIIVLSLVAGAAVRFIGVQQQTNSEIVVRKVFAALNRQWQAVIDTASREPLPPAGPGPSDPTYLYSMRGVYETQILPMAGNDPARARVIWVKARLRQEFPMNYGEILQATPAGFQLFPLTGALPALPAYINTVSAAGINLANVPTTPSAAEISSCLLMAVSQSRGGFALNADDLASDVVTLPNTNGQLQYIADGWKQPVIYFRWATGNAELNSLNPAPVGTMARVFQDPQDPNGLLLNPQWWQSVHPGTNRQNWLFENLLHPIWFITTNPPSLPGFNGLPDANWPILPGGPFPITSPPFANNPNNPNPYNVVGYEYYMVPVVASAGKNKSFGIFFPPSLQPNTMSTDLSGDDQDNIYSYRLR